MMQRGNSSPESLSCHGSPALHSLSADIIKAEAKEPLFSRRHVHWLSAVFSPLILSPIGFFYARLLPTATSVVAVSIDVRP